jgi:hypothetical protein
MNFCQIVIPHAFLIALASYIDEENGQDLFVWVDRPSA